MNAHTRRAIGALASCALVGLLTACSTDVLIWGPDGARVIDSANQFIHAAARGDASSFSCAGAHLDMREAGDWKGMQAEEPEEFDAQRAPELASLHPSWTINLSAGDPAPTPGEVQPGELVYGQNADGLCVLAVEWVLVGDVSN